MKFEEAMAIINEVKTQGFMVSFEKKEGAILCSGHFPDKHDGEELIKTEEEAWDLANRFASKTKGKYINIYVIDSSFSPVPNYSEKAICNRE